MKKIISLFILLSLSFIAVGAEDGTGQGQSSNSQTNEMIAYCDMVLAAEDGTGQDKAEDGTGQVNAEDGTGQGQATNPAVSFCNKLFK